MLGCVKGDLELDSICSTKTYSTVPGNLPVESITISKVSEYNFVSNISNFKDWGDLDISLTMATLSSKEAVDLSFLHQVSFVYLDDSGQEVVLYTSNKAPKGSTLFLGFNENPPSLKAAIKNKVVKFRLSGEGVPPSSDITPTLTVCARATQDISKSVF